MNIRRVVIGALLVSLALAAAAGVLGVLVPGREAVWRVVFTALVTAVACGLMLAATRWIDRPEARASSLFAMAVIVAEFLLCIALIWDIGRTLVLPIDQEQLGLTMLCLAACGFPAALFVRMTRSAVTAVGGWTGLVAAAASFALLMIATWVSRRSSWGWFDEKMLGSGIAVGLLSIPAVMSLVGQGTDRRYWRWAGVLASAAACAMALWGIWEEPHSPGWPLAWVVSLACVVAHANVSMFCPLKGGALWLRPATIAAVIATAGLVDAIAYIDSAPEVLERLVAAAGICAACGTLAMAILARVNRKSTLRVTPRELREIRLECPQCGKRQSLAVGAPAACAGCGLRIEVQVQEPRCPTCDYLLYGLTSPRCPECGTSLDATPAPA